VASHYLYLTNSRLVSLVWRRGSFAARREFEVSDAGVAEFEAHLAGALASTPVHVFTDLAEEDFRADTIPHVGGGDRDALVSRKLGQMFRSTPYRYALVQGREAGGRRDHRVVYTAITNPEVVRPWLEVLSRLQVPLGGIHSAAILGTRLIEALGPSEPHALLVLFIPGNALRQTYFRDGELKFTRQTPVDLEEGQSLGTFLAEETTRTWQYLDNVRSFAPDDRLEVIIVAHPRDHPAIGPALAGFQQLAYRLVDSEQVAARIGLKPPPAASSAEEILVHLFQKKPVDNHFASSEMRRDWTLRAARHAITAAAIGILAVGVVLGASNLARTSRASDEETRLSREASDMNREYDRVARALPSFGVGGAAMRDAATFYKSYIEPFPSIDGFMVELSGALEAHPAVRLGQIAWQVADDPKTVPPLATQPSRMPPPVKAVPKGGEVAARPPAADEAVPPFSGGRYEVALLEASVQVPSHDFRSALGEVERLVADIRRVPGFRAEVVESPLDVRPSLALMGRNAEKEPGAMEARFVLRLVRTRGGAA
jgi:hypothetical protein